MTFLRPHHAGQDGIDDGIKSRIIDCRQFSYRCLNRRTGRMNDHVNNSAVFQRSAEVTDRLSLAKVDGTNVGIALKRARQFTLAAFPYR